MSLPLCVDLDGTLVLTDTMYEAVFLAVKQQPSIIWHFPLWIARGKAHFKEQIGRRVRINVALLPYNQSFLEYLRQEKQAGRTLVLASGTNYAIARAVADHLGIFSQVLGSSDTYNLSGSNKAAALIEHFGKGSFIYAGNSQADVNVWKEAASGIVVNAAPSVADQARQTTTVTRAFPGRPVTFDVLRRSLRAHQWVKNILIFVPLVMAHQFGWGDQFRSALLAFVAFSGLASGIYILNDLFDLEADRQHERKKHRPLAAGALPVSTGLKLWGLLVGASLGVSLLWLPPSFLGILALYIIINGAYSLYLKQIVIIDVLILASVYTLRVFAGSAATGVPVSGWLLVFSAFLFLSLALLKRYAELSNLHQAGKAVAIGRGYASADRNLVFGVGLGSGYVAMLILVFYVTSNTVGQLYTNPAALWLMIPLLLVWISRLWWLVRQGRVHEDPIVFAVTDKASYLIGALTALILFFAS